MRIIGGKWRGRKLVEIGNGDASAHLRPTSDRTREAIFNMLCHPRYHGVLDGAEVFDIFAGTGALGLEALSRGARFCTFFENGTISAKILKENIKHLGAEAELHFGDVTRGLVPMSRKPDLIFLDPPYGKGLGEIVLSELHKMGCNLTSTIIIWEDEIAPNAPDFLQRIDQRRFGRALISIYEGR